MSEEYIKEIKKLDDKELLEELTMNCKSYWNTLDELPHEQQYDEDDQPREVDWGFDEDFDTIRMNHSAVCDELEKRKVDEDLIEQATDNW